MKIPVLFSGDFNLVRYEADKSNSRVYFKWCDKFNEWIDKHCLIEINLLGRGYTWTNNQENTVLSNIDRVFCSTELDDFFLWQQLQLCPKPQVTCHGEMA
jgi:hypothetical protein